MADQTTPKIQYYFKEDTNQILVSGSDSVANTNALITSSKNPITQGSTFYNSKIVNFGTDTSYMVKNGPEFTSLINGQSLNTFNSVVVDNLAVTSPIQITGNQNGTGASVTLESQYVGVSDENRILQIVIVETGSNWIDGETITIPTSTLITNGFTNPSENLVITLTSQNLNEYGTEIPLKSDQELWVHRGYRTVDGDGDGFTRGNPYRYNPHLHRAYKAYIVVETGSGIPANPWLPVGNPINTNAGNSTGGDIPGKFLEKQLAILGNYSTEDDDQRIGPDGVVPVSGSFQIYNPSRNIHPFVFTKYQVLNSPPIAGAAFRLYKENADWTDDTGTTYDFSTATPPYPPPANTVTFNTANASTNNKVYIDSTLLLGPTLGALSGSYANGKTGGKIKIARFGIQGEFVEYDIDSIENVGNGDYYTVDVSSPSVSPPTFINFGNGNNLQISLSEYPEFISQLNQSQNTSANSTPALFDSVSLRRTGSYSYTSSDFPEAGSNGSTASGSTQFGLYANLDYYHTYNARLDLAASNDVRVFFTSSTNTSSFIDLIPGRNASFPALVGTISQSGYVLSTGDPTDFQPDGQYNGTFFDVTIAGAASGTPTPPPDIFSRRWESAYISYSSSLSSSLDGLYVFNQLPQNDIQVTASMFITAWTGSAEGSRYGDTDSEYGTSTYDEGEAGDGPTWQTASIRIYTGSYPTSVPSVLDSFVTESEFHDENIHVGGLAITMSYLIPSESISVKDCLSLALAVSSGSAPSESVENSLVVREYYLEFNTPTSSLEGDGLVPTFVENAFENTLGFSNEPDCQPTLNNAVGLRENKFFQEVDYTTGIYNPINFQSILSGSAQKSTVPLSNYTTFAITNPRFRGSETSANDVNTIEGLVNGFGALPVIDYKTAYFAYCDQILDPYPVVNNVTQFNIKYLINEQGDALQPNASPYTALDVEGSWTAGKEGVVSVNQISGSSQFDILNGLQLITEVAKEPVAVLWSQTGANTTSSNIPLAGAPGAISTYVSEFLSYGMSVAGRNTDTNDLNDKNIPFYNVLDKINEAGFYTFNTSSRYGKISDTVINQASSSIVGELSPAPNPTAGANTPTVSYANPGEIFFNQDYFAINDSSDTPPGFDYLTGNQLSDIYTLSVLAEFPSSVPQEYRTDAGGWNDSSDYNRTNVGNISMKLQEYNGSSWVDLQMVQQAPPTMRLYFGGNQTLDINLAASFGSNNAGLRNNGTKCYIQINPTAVRSSVTQAGLEKNNALYVSFIFNLKSAPNVTLTANKKYRWVANQYYESENVDARRNFYNPTTKASNLGSTPTPLRAQRGPYITANVRGASEVSSNVDGALNTPYWGFLSGDQTTLELLSENGNAAYGGDYYQRYLPYTASENPLFPGGLEPIDTTIPSYNIPFTLQAGDEIRFQNSEIEVYKILEVIPPDQTVNGKLQVILDREVNASIDKDFFLIRRYRPSPNTIIVNSLFPYGGLITDEVQVDNTLTDGLTSFFDGQDGVDPPAPTAGDGAYYTSSMSSTTSGSVSFVSVERPLSKKDNTPTGLFFPEFPTRRIEVEPDNIIKQLRDNKLLT